MSNVLGNSPFDSGQGVRAISKRKSNWKCRRSEAQKIVQEILKEDVQKKEKLHEQ